MYNMQFPNTEAAQQTAVDALNRAFTFVKENPGKTITTAGLTVLAGPASLPAAALYAGNAALIVTGASYGAEKYQEFRSGESKASKASKDAKKAAKKEVAKRDASPKRSSPKKAGPKKAAAKKPGARKAAAKKASPRGRSPRR